ncbi:hypothetical protein CC86DRAFT_469607 [Ophiobolus disseminans]|uniref:2EXR domain-containing protein n=1 Tax=Ophiobolus disseminans TaxID=1469910 RepID=A0A6A6ZQA4_9PLEO|nr:hypothetical protein CC86DRAFT_469607 [Ophiobolus disseminans]
MEVATTNIANFSRFPTLPAELRNQIWHDALPNPDDLEPALVYFKPGCWRWQGAEPDLELYFRHDLLEIHVDIPMAFVNREARSIAVVRIRELGLVTKADSDGLLYPVFVRTFRPTVDAIYLKPSQLEDMIMDVHKAMYEPWEEGRQWSTLSRIRRIAMSEKSLISGQGMDSLEEVAELMENICNIMEVLVVVGAPADLDSADGRPLWKYIPAPGDAFRWSISRRRFVICGDECVGDGVVAAHVGSEKVVEAFTQLYGNVGYLKVRPVFAIRA